jgi:hypothetical protein
VTAVGVELLHEVGFAEPAREDAGSQVKATAADTEEVAPPAVAANALTHY